MKRNPLTASSSGALVNFLPTGPHMPVPETTNEPKRAILYGPETEHDVQGHARHPRTGTPSSKQFTRALRSPRGQLPVVLEPKRFARHSDTPSSGTSSKARSQGHGSPTNRHDKRISAAARTRGQRRGVPHL